MVDKYKGYLKSFLALPINMSDKGIGSVEEACSHYRSRAGGTVRANSRLYEEMKNDKSFPKFISEMRNILRDKIKKTDLDSYIRNAPESNRPLECITMGKYKLNIEYNHKVSIGTNYVKLHLYGEDLWDFKGSPDKGFIGNMANEVIPGMIADFFGDGLEFNISYDFEYTVEVVPEYYFILSSINSYYCLDISGSSRENRANLQIYQINFSDAQLFSFTKCGDYYYIVAKCSGKVIDVDSSGKKEGTNIQQYELNKTHAQQWKIKYSGDYCTFYSRVNGLCLDLYHSETYNGNNIHCWSDNDTNDQKFKIVSFSSAFLAPLLFKK